MGRRNPLPLENARFYDILSQNVQPCLPRLPDKKKWRERSLADRDSSKHCLSFFSAAPPVGIGSVSYNEPFYLNLPPPTPAALQPFPHCTRIFSQKTNSLCLTIYKASKYLHAKMSLLTSKNSNLGTNSSKYFYRYKSSPPVGSAALSSDPIL